MTVLVFHNFDFEKLLPGGIDMMKKVKRLKRGSRIAVLSPSSGAAQMFPHIFDMGLENLKRHLGSEIVEMPTSRKSPDWLYKNPKARAEDINAAFADETIDGIICSIGGYESVRILEHLDTESILARPKFFMGFSDSTTFLSYLNSLGMVTFYGPSVMAGFAQWEHQPEAFQKHVTDFLLTGEIPYEYPPYGKWTDGYANWTRPELAGFCLPFENNEKGFNFVQGERAEGTLWGGCIEVLEGLKGTRYWPGEDFWNGKILFLESSDKKPSPMEFGVMLRNYGTQGILHKVNGLFIGRPDNYSPCEKRELEKVVLDIVDFELGLTDLPVVMEMDFGHTDPKWILPMGVRVEARKEPKGMKLLESPWL